MVEIEPACYSEQLRALFESNPPDHPRLSSVLAGRHPGTALVDDATNPDWCALRSGWIGRTFIGGRIDAESLAQAVSILRRHGHVHLDSDDPHASMFPTDEIGEDVRYAFSGHLSGTPQFEGLLLQQPGGCAIQPVDNGLAERCLWSDELLSVFGSLRRYLDVSIGFCLVRGEQILSEAHAFFWGDGFVEIGAITNEAHRGSGYAPIVTAHLIRSCEQRGYGTYWGCDGDNVASASAARKVDYQDPRPYTLKVYGPLQ